MPSPDASVPNAAPVASPDPGVVSAARLRAGECGLICGIEGEREDLERLKVMGVCLGRRLHVIKAGDPMVVSVMGTRIGIARELAEFVAVRADIGQSCAEDRTTP